MVKEKEKEKQFISQGIVMKDNGPMISTKEMANLLLKLEFILKGNLKTVWQMDMEQNLIKIIIFCKKVFGLTTKFNNDFKFI